MYDLVMKSRELRIDLDRVLEEMDRQSLDSKKLAARAGVSEGAISKLINGKSPGMSAVNLTSVAVVLKVSVDYLMRLTDDPIPKSLTREELIIELVRIGQDLTDRRRRDLLATARAYLESSDTLKGNPKLLAADLLDLVKEAGGANSRRMLLDFLQSDRWSDDDASDGGTSLDDGDDPVDDKD